MSEARANIGVVGLAVMGSNLARNFASRPGNVVAIFNRSPERTRSLVELHPEAEFIASESIDDFVASLSKPRTAIIMVQAGAGTDAVISQLAERFEPGDIVARGFADLGFEEFQVLPSSKLLSLTAGTVSPLPTEHASHFFWIPSVDEITDVLERRGVPCITTKRIEQRDWLVEAQVVAHKHIHQWSYCDHRSICWLTYWMGCKAGP